MKKLKIILMLSFFAAGFLLQRQVAAQIVMAKSVLGNGGGVLSDSGYRIVGTLGQQITGVVQNPSNVNSVGFWYLLTHDLSTGIEQTTSSVPKEYRLEQNYPNPFNPTTKIRYELPRHTIVSLTVYDVLGREVAVLVDEEKQAGRYVVDWQPTNISSGVYLYRLQAGDPSLRSGQWFVETKKLVLVK